MLHKGELEKNISSALELFVYYCTSPTIGVKIATDNINWRLTFGKGARFSIDPHYASIKAGAKQGGLIVILILLLDT